MATQAAESVASSNNTTQNFTLRVTNLPKELEKDGVRGIFLAYGQITGCIVAPTKTETNQAYISYSKYNEAERAIHELDGKPPLHLKIEFLDKNLKSLHKPLEIDLSGPIVDHRYKESYLDHCKDMKKAIDMGPANHSPVFHPNTYTPDSDLLYPYPRDESTYNPYDSPGPYYDTNLMYTRGTTHISKDGRRHVSYGRGYTFYNMPEPHCKIPSCLQKVIEKRENRYYEYAPEEVEDDTGNCKICSSATAYRCQKCSITFYCSRACQVKDWSKHKLECSSVPPLIKMLPLKALQENGHAVQQPVHKSSPSIENLSIKEQNSTSDQQQSNTVKLISPMRKGTSDQSAVEVLPPRSNKQQRPPNNYNNNNNNYQKNSPNKQFANKQEFSPKNQKPVTDHQNQRPQNQQNFSRSQNQQAKRSPPPQRQQQQKSQQQQQSQQIVKNQLRNSDENIVFQQNEFIPRDKFVDVLIMSTVDSGEYWVLRIDRLGELKKFADKLKNHATKATLVKPEEKIRCVIEHEECWYRANIISLNSGKSKVFLYDYGLYDDVVVNKVYLETFDDEPLFARKIHLVDSADDALKKLVDRQCLSVKAMLINPDGSIVVQARAPSKEVQDSVKDPMASSFLQKATVPSQTSENIFLEKLANTPNIIQTAAPGETGMILIHANVSQDEYGVTFIPDSKVEEFTKLLENLAVACLEEVQKNPRFVPKIGDLICGESMDQEWFRGIVTETKPVVKLAVIDECRFFVPVRCAPLPADFVEIKSMGLVCKFLPDSKPTSIFQSGTYEMLEISGNPTDSAVISIESDDKTFKGKGKLTLWNPKPEQKGIQNHTLKSGDSVIALFFASPLYVFVRSNESEEKERVHRLEQEVASCALKPQPLDQAPVVGEMVLAYYTDDDNHYRATVTKIEGEKIMIKYTDYGNEETTTIEKLYKLPDLLKQQAAGCMRVKIKGVPPNIPLTSEATRYYEELVANQAILTCTFEGNPVEDGVILKTATNENVNEIVKLALQPSWEKTNTEKDDVFTINSLPSISLGNVGDEIEAVVLVFYPEVGTVILGPHDLEAAEAIQVQMGERIAKYAEKAEYYIPRDNELCIALYEGAFYRALCLESSVSPDESRVFFVDYGNTERVKHKDIRAITPDFLELPAFGTLVNMACMFPANKYPQLKDELIKLMEPNELITAKIVGLEDECFNIEIPKIRVALTEKGLL